MPPGVAPTEINPAVGGAFTLFGGHIVGRHIELVAHERLVQAWRVVDWAPGIYSIAKFILVEQGPGTKLIFDHTSFPNGQAEHLAAGWSENYWEPLAKLLAWLSRIKSRPIGKLLSKEASGSCFILLAHFFHVYNPYYSWP
jgi:activator of HSP90 ATPase